MSALFARINCAAGGGAPALLNTLWCGGAAILSAWASVRCGRASSVRPSLASLRGRTFLLVALLGTSGLIPGRIAIAQTSATLPKFEVTSIKPAKPGARGALIGMPPGRFTATDVAAITLIAFAYSNNRGFALRFDLILGGPKWIFSDTFDIEAKVEDSLVEQEEKKLLSNQWAGQIRLMVRSMLADRFKLKVHQETKELPIYILIIAKHGPKLKKSTVSPPGPLGSKRPAPAHGSMMWIGILPRRGSLELTGPGITVGDLANLLSGGADLRGREVVDQTGLQGRYDFTLKWTPDSGPHPMPGGPGASGAAGAGVGAPVGQGAAGATGGQSAAGMPLAPDSSGPSIFTAIQEQLGLKLKPAKGPVEVLVIDHVEPPTPN